MAGVGAPAGAPARPRGVGQSQKISAGRNRSAEWWRVKALVSWRAVFLGVGGRSRSPEHQPRETTMSPQRALTIEAMILAGLATGSRRRTYGRPGNWPRTTGARRTNLARKRCAATYSTSAGAAWPAARSRLPRYGLQFFFCRTFGRVWALFGGKKHRLAVAEAAA